MSIVLAAQINEVGYKVKKILLVLLSLTAASLALSLFYKQNFMATKINPENIVSTPVGVPKNPKASLYRVWGLSGKIKHGDNLLIPLYPKESRDGKIWTENIQGGEASIQEAQKYGELEIINSKYYRARDYFYNHGGSRFYLYKKSGSSKSYEKVIAVCASLKKNYKDDSNPTCSFIYDIGDQYLILTLDWEEFKSSEFSSIQNIIFNQLKNTGAINKITTY